MADFQNAVCSMGLCVGTASSSSSYGRDNTFYSVNELQAGMLFDVNLSQKLENFLDGSHIP